MFSVSLKDVVSTDKMSWEASEKKTYHKHDQRFSHNRNFDLFYRAAGEMRSVGQRSQRKGSLRVNFTPVTQFWRFKSYNEHISNVTTAMKFRFKIRKLIMLSVSTWPHNCSLNKKCNERLEPVNESVILSL